MNATAAVEHGSAPASVSKSLVSSVLERYVAAECSFAAVCTVAQAKPGSFFTACPKVKGARHKLAAACLEWLAELPAEIDNVCLEALCVCDCVFKSSESALIESSAAALANVARNCADTRFANVAAHLIVVCPAAVRRLLSEGVVEAVLAGLSRLEHFGFFAKLVSSMAGALSPALAGAFVAPLFCRGPAKFFAFVVMNRSTLHLSDLLFECSREAKLDAFLELHNVWTTGSANTLAGNALANSLPVRKGQRLLDGSVVSQGFELASGGRSMGALVREMATLYLDCMKHLMAEDKLEFRVLETAAALGLAHLDPPAFVDVLAEHSNVVLKMMERDGFVFADAPLCSSQGQAATMRRVSMFLRSKKAVVCNRIVCARRRPAQRPANARAPAGVVVTFEQLLDRRIVPLDGCERCAAARGPDASVRACYASEFRNCPNNVARKRACPFLDHSLGWSRQGKRLADECRVLTGESVTSARRRLLTFMKAKFNVEPLGDERSDYQVTMHKPAGVTVKLACSTGGRVSVDLRACGRTACPKERGVFAGFRVVEA